MTRRDPYSWTSVRLPERDLSEVVLELAAPLLERLGSAPAVDDARAVVAVAVSFWNANVMASKLWASPRVKDLNALKKRMRGRGASREDAATFDLLTERWRKHWLDPQACRALTVYAMMPSALKLFAEGHLTRVGGDPVEVAIGGRKLGRWCSPRSVVAERTIDTRSPCSFSDARARGAARNRAAAYRASWTELSVGD